MATPFVSNEARLQGQIDELADHLERYLAGELSHVGLQELIERHFGAWEQDPVWQAAEYAAGEHTYWCAIWAAQHLADEDHWRDGLPQKELSFLLPFLRDRHALPKGWDGRRPSDATAI